MSILQYQLEGRGALKQPWNSSIEYFKFVIFLDKTKVSSSCKEGDFLCPTDGTCIPGHWLCDGTVDCVRDAADEENCSEYQNIICCQALCQFSSLIFSLKIGKDWH